MKHMKKQRLVVCILVMVITAVLLIGAIAGFAFRGGNATAEVLNEMRFNSVIHAASDGLVSSIAKKASGAKLTELRKRKDFRQLGSDKINELCAEAEAEARAEAEASYANVTVDETTKEKLSAAIDHMESVMTDYAAVERAEKEIYSDIYTEIYDGIDNWTLYTSDVDPAQVAVAIKGLSPALSESTNAHLVDGLVQMVQDKADKKAEEEALAAEGSEEGNTTGEVSETTDDTFTVDEAYFTPSESLTALKVPGDEAFISVFEILSGIIPDLANLKGNTYDDIEKSIQTIVNSASLDFAERYAVYKAEETDRLLSGGTAFKMMLAANAKNLMIGAIAAALLVAVLIFWETLTGKLGVPRTIICLFFIYLCLAIMLYNISVPLMLGNVLERVGMYGILVLAMLPGIQCGIGLNMGMTLGCISGLLATVISLEYNMTGGAALVFASVAGILIAIPLGWAYSILLNKMKGDEMTISTYVGYSFVSLMCIGWMLLPFKNTKIIWLLSGKGLRVTHSLLDSFAHLLDNFLAFKLFGINIPTGLLLVFLLACGVMWVFSRSRLGVAMTAVGSNPNYAQACGLNVDRYRTLGTILSTCIAALGIVIYSQAFGYAQLYTAPRQLGFIAASAILIGGATTSRAKVGHVIIGVFLFEGVLALGQQMANAVVAGGGLSEVMRIMISNGIILYALTQSGGSKNE